MTLIVISIRMEVYTPNNITGKYYRLRNYSNSISLSSIKSYCIDHSIATWNILGIWENKDECLKMYNNNPIKNRIGGLNGLDTNATCWDVLSEIHKSEYEQCGSTTKHWYIKRDITDVKKVE